MVTEMNENHPDQIATPGEVFEVDDCSHIRLGVFDPTSGNNIFEKTQ